MASSKNKRTSQSRKKSGTKSKRPASNRLAAKFASADEMAVWPVLGCYINKRWRGSQHLAQIVFARGPCHGYVGIAVLLVDLQCLGVKNAFVRRTDTEGLLEMMERMESAESMTEADPGLAVKVIEQAVAYAESYGFEPPASFANAKKIIGDVDTSGCDIEIPCGGKDGKPFYVAGPRDDIAAILHHLEERCGPDGFEFISPIPIG